MRNNAEYTSSFDQWKIAHDHENNENLNLQNNERINEK